MDEKQFESIRTRLDAIIKLQALVATQNKALKDQVSILSSCGFQPKEIADMLGKTPNHISVILHDLRKGKKAQEGAAESGTQDASPSGTQDVGDSK